MPRSADVRSFLASPFPAVCPLAVLHAQARTRGRRNRPRRACDGGRADALGSKFASVDGLGLNGMASKLGWVGSMLSTALGFVLVLGFSGLAMYAVIVGLLGDRGSSARASRPPPRSARSSCNATARRSERSPSDIASSSLRSTNR